VFPAPQVVGSRLPQAEVKLLWSKVKVRCRSTRKVRGTTRITRAAALCAEAVVSRPRDTVRVLPAMPVMRISSKLVPTLLAMRMTSPTCRAAAVSTLKLVATLVMAALSTAGVGLTSTLLALWAAAVVASWPRTTVRVWLLVLGMGANTAVTRTYSALIST
jgi:hypothetical protein